MSWKKVPSMREILNDEKCHGERDEEERTINIYISTYLLSIINIYISKDHPL